MKLKSNPSFDEFLNEKHHNKSTPIEYKGKTYYVNTNDLEDKKVEKVFVYNEPELTNTSKFNGLTLVFKKDDIEDMLKK